MWRNCARADTPGYFIIDSDVVLLRNMAARLARKDYDLVFQRELPCHSERMCVNAGVWWVRTGSFEAVRVLEYALRFMDELHLPDQDALQQALVDRPALKLAVLDASYAPNGFVYNVDRRLDARTLRLVHFNWAPSHRAKLERLNDVGVVAKYPYCFRREMRAALHGNYSSITREARGLRSPLSMPYATLTDVASAVDCAEADRSCLRRRVEPHVLAPYLQ